MFVLVPSHQRGLDKISPWFVLHPTPPAICTEMQRVNDTWWFDTGGCVVSTFISPSCAGTAGLILAPQLTVPTGVQVQPLALQ